MDILPALPRKLNALVDEARQQEMREAYLALIRSQQRQNWLLGVIALILLMMLVFK